MTDVQQSINRLLSYSEPTRTGMYIVRKNAVERSEAGLKREKQHLANLRCANLLSDFDLKMGQTIQHNNISYVLADVDGSGNPVGHRLKADGSINPSDKVSLFRYRLERLTRS